MGAMRKLIITAALLCGVSTTAYANQQQFMKGFNDFAAVATVYDGNKWHKECRRVAGVGVCDTILVDDDEKIGITFTLRITKFEGSKTVYVQCSQAPNSWPERKCISDAGAWWKEEEINNEWKPVQFLRWDWNTPCVKDCDTKEESNK
jgi:hypothetical protein